jgi:hypothetical protein
MDSNPLTPLLWSWVLILLPLTFVVLRRPSCGLVLSYCFQMWMLYWLGALIHTFPWSDLPDTDLVLLGFQQATWGIAAFAIGVIMAGPAIGTKMLGNTQMPPAGFEPEMDITKARRYIMMGLISYFIIRPTLGRIPGLNAVPASASELVVTGCCLQAWMAWKSSGKPGLLRVLPQTLLIPLVVLVKQGFMSYGVLAISTIMIFVSQFFRPRWILTIAAVVCGYLGLTFYVSYMRDRTDIREVLWYSDSSLSEKLGTAWHTATTLEPFDAKDPDHLMYIDERLNQNGMVGAAVENLSGTGAFNNGSTIVDALEAMVPRLLWPSKPVGAGSGDMVAKLTGLEFAEGTSVGVGPVLEFYGNFGTTGVVLGLFFFGALVGALDFCAGAHLRLGNWAMFTSFFLVGISCLNVSGSLVEVTSGAMASVAVAALVRRIERKRERKALFTPEPVGVTAR